MKKLFANKRGEDDASAHVIGRKIFYYIFLLIIIGIVLTSFFVYVNKALNARVAISDGAHADFIIARVVNVCFAAQDPNTGELLPNILDYGKINSQNLESCFVSPYPPRITVFIKPLEDKAFPIVTAKIQQGGTSDYQYTRYTVVNYNGRHIPAQLYLTR